MHVHTQGRQITTADLEEMGHCFCQGLSQLRKSLTEQEAQDQQDTEEGKNDEDTQSAGSDRYMYKCI